MSGVPYQVCPAFVIKYVIAQVCLNSLVCVVFTVTFLFRYVRHSLSNMSLFLLIVVIAYKVYVGFAMTFRIQSCKQLYKCIIEIFVIWGAKVLFEASGC